jgi:ARG and Rhodanese-Phosphatase-superfamily-associated Protein domain
MRWRTSVAWALAVAWLFCLSMPMQAGDLSHSGYKVLAPLASGNLTIFPVVSNTSYNTSMFLTLDEGLHSGEVVVTEASGGRGAQPLIRRGGTIRDPSLQSETLNAQVNTLMLVNNSKRPLLLLAGEIVTGGKQDRVIGKDRIVPPQSEPVDLGVFCVEPGRWVARSDHFGGFSNLAQPSVRINAMANQNQQMVWDSVRKSQAQVARNLPSAAPAIGGTTSYAGAMNGKEVNGAVDKIAAPIERDYRGLIRELRDKHAVGVVVAVNGEILWADIFASTDLLDRYWPKLVRSYAAEALSAGERNGKVMEAQAQAFVDQLQGRHETSDTDPGVFRQVEITGDNYKVFELTSLLPKTNFEVHIAKMHEESTVGRMYRGPYPIR